MNQLLSRSAQLQEALVASFGTGVMLFDESPRLLASASVCQFSIEHATVLRLALGAGAVHSAAALLRLQHEAMVRAAWLLHVASASEIGQWQQLALGTGDMLAALAAKAPPGQAQPLQRLANLPADPRSAQTIRHSNALLYLAFCMIARLSASQAQMERTAQASGSFEDCLLGA